MRIRILLLAGAGVAGTGLAMLGLSDRPNPPARGMVVVTAPAQAPAATRPLPVAVAVASAPAASPATPDVAEVASAPASEAPANYAYYEGGDPGVWAAPAEFSGAR